MKQIHILLLSFLSVVPAMVCGQGTVLTKASRNEQLNHFVDASEDFQGLYQRGDREASLQAARNLYKARRYEEALPLYAFADSLRIISDAEQVFAYFECLKSVKRYADADRLVKSRLGEFADRPEFGIHQEKLKYYESIQSYKGTELKLLRLNSAFSDISPTVYRQWLYFVSTRPATGNHSVHRINMQPFYNLYGAPLDNLGPEVAGPKGAFGKPAGKIRVGSIESTSLPEGVNQKFHDGPVNVTPSGKYLFFTTNQFEGKRPGEVVNLGIYYSENQADQWQLPKPLPSNSPEYSNQHGYFDEAAGTLYFASNRPGGKGGWDIWKSKFNPDGTWSDAVNLGDEVNTVKTEVFPTLDAEGKLLFASNGWPGLGGLDLFVAQPGGKPLNMLAGINSEKDDFGMVFTGKEGGYLVSNRPGGTGDDDIYSFEMKYDLSVIRTLNGYEVPVVFTLKDSRSGSPIASSQATVLRGGIEIPLNLKDGDAPGLMPGDEVVLRSAGYAPFTVKVTTSLLAAGRATTGFEAIPNPEPSQAKDAELTGPPAPSFPPVYFDYRRWSLTSASRSVLKEIIKELNGNPMMRIEVRAYTDCRGDVASNLELSRNRQQAVVKHLRAGITNPERVIGQAFGEEGLVNDCACEGPKQSTCGESGHRLNRRAELVVITSN